MAVAGLLGELPAVLALDLGEQATQVVGGVPVRFRPPKVGLLLLVPPNPKPVRLLLLSPELEISRSRENRPARE